VQKFDLVTHKRNKKGILTGTNHYRLHIKGNSWKFERPPGSGNMYSLGGDLMEGTLLEEQKNAAAKAKAETEALEKLVVEVKEEPKVLKTEAVEPILQTKAIKPRLTAEKVK